MTNWARDRLTQLISEATFVMPNMAAIIDVTKVLDLDGDASITLSRGKKRYACRIPYVLLTLI